MRVFDHLASCSPCVKQVDKMWQMRGRTPVELRIHIIDWHIMTQRMVKKCIKTSEAIVPKTKVDKHMEVF